MSLMCHEAGRKCLLELDNILYEIGLSHFLMQGTALGAYRDGGFVPTERDIDIGILYEDLCGGIDRLLAKLMSNNFDIEAFVIPFTRPRTVVAFKQYEGKLVKADIVGMIPYKGKRFTAPPIRDYVDPHYCLVHEAHMVEKYRRIMLFDRHFNIPADTESYLLREYGPSWDTPQDDSESRTRVYNYLQDEGIPHDYLEQFVA